MKASIVLLIWVVLLPSALFAVGEKTLSVGAAGGWQAIAARSSITELKGARPHPVLALSSAGGARAEEPDLYLSFDEGSAARFVDGRGHYTVRAGAGVQTVENRWARKGAGAALFTGTNTVMYRTDAVDPLVITPVNSLALFAPRRNIGDFSIEFFLYPANLESGEEIFEWRAASAQRVSGRQAGDQSQSIRAIVARNRLHWTFTDFFIAPDGRAAKNISLDAQTPQTPGRWSHHHIRFDANTGLLEYLVDDVIEGIAYATLSGREGSEVWTPVAGERGVFSVGKQFNGFLDELIIAGSFSGVDSPRRYAPSGGRIETEPLDLKARQSSVHKVDVWGGAVRLGGRIMNNEYRRGGSFQFDTGAQIQFFIRASDSPYALSEVAYKPFKSGEPLASVHGRFVQIMADLYPSGDLESTPYLEEFVIEYLPKPAPKAPLAVSALARDGVVELSWKNGNSGADEAGYLVYYGTRSGEYFGTGAGRGASPIDAGKTRSIQLDSLQNGVLYYFAVAAYDDSGPASAGALSKEVSARPLRMLE